MTPVPSSLLYPDQPVCVATWTIYPDFGGSPFLWTKSGFDDQQLLGGLLLDGDDAPNYFEVLAAKPLGKAFEQWCRAFELYADWRTRLETPKMDWNVFHQDGLYLAAVLAELVAPMGVAIIYHFPHEDDIRGACFTHVVMTPGEVEKRLRHPTLSFNDWVAPTTACAVRDLYIRSHT